MKTELEQAAILAKYQCCFAELASRVSSKLGKHKLCNMTDDLRDMKFSRAYLLRIHNYWTLPFSVESGTLVTIVRTSGAVVTMTITIDGTDYAYTGTGNLATIVAALKALLITAGYNIYTTSDGAFIFYTYASALDNIVVTCATVLDESDTTSSITCSGYTDATADVLLDADNCLSRTEICGIINQMDCILCKYCTDCA